MCSPLTEKLKFVMIILAVVGEKEGRSSKVKATPGLFFESFM
jgi:hypothetical protein